MRTFRLGAPVGGAPIAFSNTTPITIPSSGPGVPYPSTISVSGVTGTRAIKVELTDISHAFPDDVDFLLEGPNGQNLIILSDAGGTNDWIADDITLTDSQNPASDAGASRQANISRRITEPTIRLTPRLRPACTAIRLPPEPIRSNLSSARTVRT